MTWSDVIREPPRRVVRQFGVLVCLGLAGAGLHQWLARGQAGLGGGLVGLGLACLALGWLAPGVFRWAFTGSMVLVFPIGFVVSQVILALMFFGVFLPIGLLLRLRGWDAMLRHRKPAGESYWEPKPVPRDPRRYLRQY